MQADHDRRTRTGTLLLGARLRQRRKQAGLELSEAAERCGVTYAYLSNIERGHRLPTLPVLDALSLALDTSVVALLQGLYPWDESEPPKQPPLPPPDGRAGRAMPPRRPPED